MITFLSSQMRRSTSVLVNGGFSILPILIYLEIFSALFITAEPSLQRWKVMWKSLQHGRLLLEINLIGEVFLNRVFVHWWWLAGLIVISRVALVHFEVWEELERSLLLFLKIIIIVLRSEALLIYSLFRLNKFIVIIS